MASKEVPPIVAAFAAQVKMTPIAWRFESGYVVIVFEQGPKMRFDLEEAPVVAKPAIHIKEKPVVFVKSAGKKLPSPLKKKK
jgi:hypothetical protein